MITINQKIKPEPKTTNKTNSDYDRKIRVVVVEDSSEVVHCLELQLARHFKLKFFVEAEKALEYLFENGAEIELVILDNMLPGMSGMHLLSIIKRNPWLKHLPVILQSAEDKNALNAYRAQPDFYLQKPWSAEEMKNAIKQALGITAL